MTLTPTRSDMERRLWLLEMAGGNIQWAVAMDLWVMTGEHELSERIDIPSPEEVRGILKGIERTPPIGSPTASASPPSPEHESGVVPGTDTRGFDEIAGELPAHLRRT